MSPRSTWARSRHADSTPRQYFARYGGSVRFAQDRNANYRTENGAPYAHAGGSGGNYFPWTAAVENHILTATP